ncbi:hypothetical protein P43SY_002072 [Pythium insidiosum]|uniref:Protein kinase domain-containing protein n=1 Tax=Pythium insidiosum TaxID=114742 RepID=A0AAD5L963_PYTIN|nr:hypothetical protein P43SY_002072 [Pythium insidiosum]
MRGFRVRGKICNGLFGPILECERAPTPQNPTVGTPVVIKCISLEAAEQAATMAGRKMDDPLQEQRVAAALIASGGHRHVLQFYDHFIDNGTLYIVTEYCRDGDLFELTSTSPNGILPERQALECMRQVAQGVQFLHQHNIAHRDLSLENVLMRNGVCKISDFGLSMPADQTSNERAGKEYYMAPEVVAGEKYDPGLADVWSMGIMLFIMLTGSPLLPVASPSERGFASLAAVGVGAVLTAWGVRDQFSDPLVDLLVRMLQIDPMKRIDSAGVLAHPVMMGFP